MTPLQTTEGAPIRDCRRFSATRASVRRARQFVSGTLPPISTTDLENAQMMVSELASNCVLHAASEFEVCIIRSDGALRIEVTDFGEGTPVRFPPDTERLGGRGLLIVGELADDWGVDDQPEHAGKTVWFKIDPAR
jgi:anti-sigma regulatory factor (Ser/Thr protein kinase)